MNQAQTAIVGALILAISPPAVNAAETRDDATVDAAQAAGPATDQDDTPPVTPDPNRGYGGRAATGHLTRKLEKSRRSALKAKPKTGEALQDWLNGPSILGEWGGYRQQLDDLGITFGGFSGNAFFANATGGARRSATAASFTQAWTDLDFEKLSGWTGFLIHTEMAITGGNNLSGHNRVGNLFNVATEYTPNGVYLGQMYAQQAFFGDALSLQVGRLTTTNNFATLPVFTDYVSVAGNGTPTALPLGSTYFTYPPAVEWGAVATAQATSRITVAGGVYNTNNSSAAPQASQNGTDFGLTFDNGVMAVSQITYTDPATDPICLPGIFAFGSYYSSADYPRLRNGRDKSGNYGFYWMAQQMVYQQGGPGSPQGLTPWFAVAWNPEESADFLPLYVSGGAVYQGLIPGRNTDTTALAVYSGTFSKFAQNTTTETVLEANYTLWATPWLGITPDFQYVFNPMGGASKNDAAVFGGQILIVF
ncbi:MAG: carbohydrate porin [Rhodospirillales bacterium]|nr:carbohydrate porin [Rhodospirillales bacterium]